MIISVFVFKVSLPRTVSISDRAGLRNVQDIKKFGEEVLKQLQRELLTNPSPVAIKGDVSVLNKLLNKRHALR